MKFTSTVFLFLSLFGNARASGGTCACEAEELGFEINCADTEAMTTALDFLASNGCASDCSSEDCEKNWYIVQTHHDFCPEADLPESVEDDFHNYDEVCPQCEIRRQFVEGAPACPAPSCEDESGNEAYTSLITQGCNIDCSSTECQSLFHVLLITHDACDHDVLSDVAERGYHDVERACVGAVCNDLSGVLADPLVCVAVEDDHDHDHHDEDEDHHDEDEDHHDEDEDHHDEEHDHDHDEEESSSMMSAGVSAAATGAMAVLMGAAVLLA